MTRRLGRNGRSGLAILATLSLAVALAGGGTTVGCGSSSRSNSAGDSGAPETGTVDSGPKPDSSVPDSGTLDTGVADTFVPEASTPQVATPSCSPAPGTFTSSQSVTISDTTAGATIYFTEDGTNPNPHSQVFSTPLSINKTTQVRAYATEPGFADSTVVSCPYTLNIPPNQVAPPTPTYPGGIYNNDFPATLGTTTAGATICYTLDGTTPVCTNGVCTAPTLSYPANGIPINGSQTGAPPNVGKVTLNAIACEAGMADGAMAPVQYTLQVATPTIQAPGTSTITYVSGAQINPTVASATNGATGLYTTNAGLTVTTAATCSAGTTIGALPSNQIKLNDKDGNQAVSAVGCKAGYVDSTPATAVYSVQLNPPNVGATVQPATYDNIERITLDDSLNSGATTEFSCVSSDGVTVPTCACASAGMTKVASGSQIVFASDKRVAVTIPPTVGDLNVDGSLVQAVACGTNFITSKPYTSAAYHEKLDPIAFKCSFDNVTFTACTGAASTIPNAGGVYVQINQSAPVAPSTTQEAYDFICSSTDGSTPDCTCSQVAPSTLTRTAGVTYTTAKLTTAKTVQAVGCLNPTSGALSTGNGALGDVFLPSDAPFASQKVTATGTMSSPTIEQCSDASGDPTKCSGSPNMANPQQVEFLNNGADAAYFCYTTDNTAVGDVAATPACYATGSTNAASGAFGKTYCTTASTQAGKVSTDGPFGLSSAIAAFVGPIPTGQWVHAIACDATSGAPLKPSAEATPVQYALVVGTPVITAKGAVNFGQAITITSTTASADIHYSTNGTTPDCSGAYASFPTSSTADANGLYEATYYAMAQETGAFTVVGCKAGYTVSPGTDTTTFTYSVAKPVVLYADGATLVPVSPAVTYDDYLNITIQEPVNVGGGVSGTWFCIGTTPGCSVITGQCTGANTFTLPGTCNGTTLGGVTTNSAGQPTSPPPVCSVGNLALPNTVLALIPNVIACVPKEPATSSIEPSAVNSLVLNFKVSQVALTSPASMPAAGNVTFAGMLSNTPPDGDATQTGATGNFDEPGGFAPSSYVCASATNTIASLGGQPSNCGTFATTPPTGWACQVSSGNGGLGDPGPTLTLTDQGASATYAAFVCKDSMAWTTGSFPVTFTPYVHAPTFLMTGAPSDFTAGKENLSAADGATAWMTFDQNNLYIGFDKGAVPAPTDVIHFYVGSKSGGTTLADSNFNTVGGADLPNTTDTPSLPGNFNALYHFYWKLDNSLASTASKWTGTTWAADGNPLVVKYNTASTFVELSVPLSALAGTNGDLHLLGGDWTGATQFGAWPAPNPDTGAAVTPAWTTWQAAVLADAFSPNDPKLLNLP